jgi:hypothetical protein
MFCILLISLGASNLFPLVDAKISFPSGLLVQWDGLPLGTIKMDSLSIVGDAGGTIDSDSTFQVQDVGHLTAFTKVSFVDCCG